jgi:hypothetical protein
MRWKIFAIMISLSCLACNPKPEDVCGHLEDVYANGGQPQFMSSQKRCVSFMENWNRICKVNNYGRMTRCLNDVESGRAARECLERERRKCGRKAPKFR